MGPEGGDNKEKIVPFPKSPLFEVRAFEETIKEAEQFANYQQWMIDNTEGKRQMFGQGTLAREEFKALERIVTEIREILKNAKDVVKRLREKPQSGIYRAEFRDAEETLGALFKKAKEQPHVQ